MGSEVHVSSSAAFEELLGPCPFQPLLQLTFPSQNHVSCLEKSLNWWHSLFFQVF